jgi:ERO1-like protein alpha
MQPRLCLPAIACDACAGVATALKILFSSRDCSGELPASSELPFGEDLVLERNEVIALVNLLGRFSHSLETYHRLTARLQRQQGVEPSITDKAAVV